MKYLSICSGIEAATVAWHPMGWTPEAFSEIEKFPSAVLAQRYPTVCNFGDMTKYKEWNIGKIDLLVGGTPCQSFSIAGLRKGLDDPRGNLALVYLGIAERFRPRWFLWENVPGVLSSYSGPEPPSDLEEGQEWETEETSDFECFTTALAKLGYGWAYRILDAQYFGVPQRRGRVFVVGYLGDWRRAASVLFERHSLSGDSPPSREKRKEITGGAVVSSETAPSLRAQPQSSHRTDSEAFAMAHGQGGAEIVKNGAPSLTCNHEAPICFNSNAHPDEMAVANTVIGQTASQSPAVCFEQNTNNSQVRRLTPVECERLQGFPDNYTRISWRNKQPENCPDGPRYKALGNSMAVPVMRWLGERISLVDKI